MITARDLKQLHESSYKETPDKDVNGWIYDPEISKKTALVYYHPQKQQAIVIHRGTEATVKDWGNNVAYLFNAIQHTHRYKEAERVQRRAEEKYPNLLTSGHSQGAIYTQLAKNKANVININPASKGETVGTTIRSENDPVSLLAGISNKFTGKKTITTPAKKSLLDAHSLDILDDLDESFGTGLKRDMLIKYKKFMARRFVQPLEEDFPYLSHEDIEQKLREGREVINEELREFDETIRDLHQEYNELSPTRYSNRRREITREIQELKQHIDSRIADYEAFKKTARKMLQSREVETHEIPIAIPTTSPLQNLPVAIRKSLLKFN